MHGLQDALSKAKAVFEVFEGSRNGNVGVVGDVVDGRLKEVLSIAVVPKEVATTHAATLDAVPEEKEALGTLVMQP